MIDINRPVRTRDGREVVGLQITADGRGILGILPNGEHYAWTLSGGVIGLRHETSIDLVNIEVQP